jgi:hypothetical protein
MAYTKSPTQDTHGVKPIFPDANPILVSQTAFLSSIPTSRYVNCFPLKEKQWANEPIFSVHKRDSWDVLYNETGDTLAGTVKGANTVQATNELYDTVFYTFGSGLYSLNYSNGVNDLISSTGTTNSRGTLTNAIDNSNVRKIALLEGGGGVSTYLTLCNEDGSSPGTTDLVTLNLAGEKGLVFIDGYLFATNTTGTKIYNSAPGGVLTTWNSTDFLDAEQYADPVVYLEKHKNYLVAFGSNSIEFFYNAGVEVGSPLTRQESYSRRLGLYIGAGGFFTSNSRFVARVNDDLYFLSKSDTDNVELYAIKNFQVTPVGENQYISGLLNDPAYGINLIYSCVINNNHCIVVSLLNGGGDWAYLINEDVWFRLSGTDYPADDNNMIGVPFMSVNTTPPRAFYIKGTTGNIPELYTPRNTVSITATYITTPIDFDTNRYKHLARVDVIGDFNTNSLTLGLGTSLNYSQPTYTFYSQAADVVGYQNNISWYNLGAWRQFYFTFSMVGTESCIFRRFDVEYNMGVA